MIATSNSFADTGTTVFVGLTECSITEYTSSKNYWVDEYSFETEKEAIDHLSKLKSSEVLFYLKNRRIKNKNKKQFFKKIFKRKIPKKCLKNKRRQWVQSLYKKR